MNFKRKHSQVLACKKVFGWLILGALLSANTRAAGVEGPIPEFNRRATATAQILAGITPNPADPALNRLLELDAWKEHQKWMTAQWSEVRGRIKTVESWRDQELKIANAPKKTLLYPFSGPDFFNAYAFFPNHSRYIFFSLERPGALPDLESVTAQQFAKLLTDVRGAFRDIFERNYFITSYMSKQLTTPWMRGTVPVMATMMALMNRRIVRIEPIDLFPDLTKAYEPPESKRPRMIMRGVRIEFSNPGASGVQQLYYFSLDVTDKALEFYPDFLSWVGQNRPASALIKSASYLLHDAQFSKTKEMVLESADLLVQDDTGIPYRFISQSPWQAKLYGKYHKPIKPMGYGYQKDLDAAFKVKAQTNELPFPFGYHWRGSQGGLILATKERNSN